MALSLPVKKEDNENFKKIYKNIYQKAAKCFFPIGMHHRWHSGVHILTDEPARAIADGEVVAFRLEDDYFDTTNGKKSNCFVLVKHKMTINDVETEFFSLYMNLLPARYYFRDDLYIDGRADKIVKKYPEFIFKRIFKASAKLDLYKEHKKKSRNKINKNADVIFERESDFRKNGNNIIKLDKTKHTGREIYVDVNKYTRKEVKEFQRKYFRKALERIFVVSNNMAVIGYNLKQTRNLTFHTGKLYHLDCMDHVNKIKNEEGKTVKVYGLNIMKGAGFATGKIGHMTNGSLFKLVDDADYLKRNKVKWIPIFLDSIVGNESTINSQVVSKLKVGYIYAKAIGPCSRWREVKVEKATIDPEKKGVEKTSEFFRPDNEKRGDVFVLRNSFKIKEGEFIGYPSEEFADKDYKGKGFHFEIVFSEEMANRVIRGTNKEKYFYYFNKNDTFYVKKEPVIVKKTLYPKEVYTKEEGADESFSLKPVTQQLWVNYRNVKVSPITRARDLGRGWHYRYTKKRKFLKNGELLDKCKDYMMKDGDNLYFKAFYNFKDKDSYVWCELKETRKVVHGNSGMSSSLNKHPWGNYRRLPFDIANIDLNTNTTNGRIKYLQDQGKIPAKLWVKRQDIAGFYEVGFDKKELIQQSDSIQIKKDFKKVYIGNPYAADNKPDRKITFLKNEDYDIYNFNDAVLSVKPKKVYVWVDYTLKKEADICPFDWTRAGLLYKWSPVSKYSDGTDVKKEFGSYIIKKVENVNGIDTTAYYVKGYLDESKSKFLWCKIGNPGVPFSLEARLYKPKTASLKKKLRRVMLEVADIDENKQLLDKAVFSVKYSEVENKINKPEITKEIVDRNQVINVTGYFKQVYNLNPLDENNTEFNAIEDKIKENVVFAEDSSVKVIHQNETWRGFEIDQINDGNMVWVKQDDPNISRRDDSRWIDEFKEDKKIVKKNKIVAAKNENIFSPQRGIEVDWSENIDGWHTKKSIINAFKNENFRDKYKTSLLISQTEWGKDQWSEKIEEVLIKRDKHNRNNVTTRIKNLHAKYYWYKKVKDEITTLPAAGEVVSFHPIKFIEHGRKFLANKNQRIVQYFKGLVLERSGPGMWKDDGVNIVSIRHLGQDEGERAVKKKRHANDLWILIVDNQVKAFFLANTEPGVTVYKNSVARGGIACLIPGDYKYIPKISTEKLRSKYRNDKPSRMSGFCNPEKDLPVWRDSNGDGKFDVVEQKPAKTLGRAIQLHWMGGIGGNLINSYSAGCQGIKGDHYIDADERVRHFLDSEYKIHKELHDHGSWSLFMKMVAGKVFDWDVPDTEGSLKNDQRFVYYHLFDENKDNIDKGVINRAEYVKRMIDANK